jgi:Protein of unknown function (DUF3089)
MLMIDKEPHVLKKVLFAVIASATLFHADGLSAQAQAPAPPPAPASTEKIDYSDGKTWLCRPGRQDACAIDLTTTVIAPDGAFAREAWTADPKAPIDCFYVYPTVSTDAGINSDMTADPAELNVVATQFARFGSKCRPYAPLYRQVTLAGLRAMMAKGAPALDRGIAYDDVLNAWNYYLQHDNQGRGVVLVGHSQGSFVLAELIRQEIDGKPVQSRMVSAILMGATFTVPKGRDVGGTFKNIPVCKSNAQIGCVISFASFRSTIPPPANTLFGRAPSADQVAICTNPAALGGGSGQLHAYLSAGGRTIVGSAPPKPWVTPDKKVETPYVSVPGLLTAQCSTNENATFLEVTVHGNPSDARADDISGDIGAAPNIQANWGLHLIDANLAIGNLVDIVGQETKAYLSKK